MTNRTPPAPPSAPPSAAVRPGARLPLVPAVGFVLIWSSGYIVGPWGVEAMSPLALVAARFVLAAVLAAVVARVLRGPLRVSRGDVLRIGLSGFVLNGVQFAAMYLAFDRGMGATLGSLMHSLSPVLTAVLAAALLRERLRPVQVLGFAVGVAGVLLVLGPDLQEAGGPVAVGLGVVSVLGLSLGTLGQRWIGHAPDPLWSAAIQFGVSAPPLVVLALLVEGTDVVRDPLQAGASLALLVVVNSLVGLFLLGVLVRARGAGAAGSVFFLMPPVTAVMAWLALGETLGVREVLGLVVTIVAVAAATRSGTPVAPVPPEPGTRPTEAPR
ncbi:Permease of the drug/metabolite transporter (DMT) superfamily [Nocardioides scoriae]|uniref:Permease of the drug/metabolite transporter (DMT) superfamily n=1 Tax=Nocardioides scoriae TaxID=642780 RepID=A0A1H1WCL4_9ACTN|nr:DMT family transporter [Nocardioides scoriae]SDS94815.1 Permease of the drug/metabolite transporter (DMT) superfamily [Nocardioides scoriae]